jgi:hypothetical protein
MRTMRQIGMRWQLMTEWNGTVVLTTPRLLLRTFRRGDLPHYAALNADPGRRRYRAAAWRAGRGRGAG